MKVAYTWVLQINTLPALPTLLQINTLLSTGLRQDEICNMASISVVLLGLNPETRIKPVLEYLKKRGVPGAWLSEQCACMSASSQ